MPSDIQSSNEHLEPAGSMGFSLDLEKNSKRLHNSKMRKERVPLPQANLGLNYQDKLKVKNRVDIPSSGPSHELKQNADGGLVQPKSSGDCERPSIKGKAKKKDEFIKYMSDVPGYLQRVESGENFQEKALNVGVLDWSRLEKWKLNQESIPARGSKNASSSGGDSSQKTSVGSSTLSGVDHCKSHAQRVKPSAQKVMRFQDFETASRSTLDGQRKIPWTYKSFGGNHSDEKSKRKDLDQKITSEIGNLSPNLRNQGISYRLEKSVKARDGKAKKVGALQKAEIRRNNLDEEITSELRASSSKVRSYRDSPSAKEKINAENGDTKMRVQEFQKPDVDLAHHCPGEHKNIVLLLPKKYFQNSLSEVFQLSEHRTSAAGESTEADRSNFSGDFSPGEVHSSEPSSEVPHLCPLPSRVETTSEPDMLPRSKINARGMELRSGAAQVPPCSNEVPTMLIQGKYAAKDELNVKPMDSNVVESPRISDQAINERGDREGRSSTPNRRFSFGLGRMRRSFSLKEGSAVPQLSSTYVSAKSGPVRSEASDSLDSPNKEKGNVPNRARSSPLRRLLDPLLKSKAATSLHSAESVRPSKINLNSSSFRSTDTTESIDSEKHVASTVQAFLQLTVKNGLPLFRFVADNNNHVLAATMRNFTTPEKDDSSENFTFYSVKEIKKKSGGWMNQGSKEKKCEYAYNVVGQMKVSSPHSSALRGRDSDQYVIRESVLFGVESQPEEQGTKPATHRELAAVVVKIPSGILSHGARKNNEEKDVKEKDFRECFPEHRFSCNLEDNEDSASTVVIIPGGVHSLPQKGVPSSLIDRWRSGGSCDCGGWDVGCKLLVLSNYDQYNQLPKLSKTCPIQERFELFVQEGGQQERPIFSLAPIKNGIYSIAFSASVSLLQAFFISVAVLNCQKFPELSRDFQEPTLDGNDGMKTPSRVQDEVSAKYVPNPPLSPVGRV